MKIVNSFNAVLILLLLVTPGAAVIFSGTGDAPLNLKGDAYTLGAGFGSIGVTTRAEYDRRFIRSISKNGVAQSSPLAITKSSTLFSLGFGVLSMLDLSVAIPFYLDYSGNDAYLNSYGIGDLSVGTKISLTPPKWDKLVSSSFLMEMSFPIGNENEGYTYHQLSRTRAEVDTASLFSTNGLVLNPNIILSFNFANGNRRKVPLLFTINAGGIVSTNSELENIATYGARLNYEVANPITLFTSFLGSTGSSLLTEDFQPSIYSNRAGLGLLISTPLGFNFSLSSDFGLGTQGDTLRTIQNDINGNTFLYQTQSGGRYGGEFSINWSGAITRNDIDRDSIRNEDDICPHVAEDYDGFKDSDGCPELDNDNDAIMDVNDKCPLEKEDEDGFEDHDGCPESDNDKDGVVDSLDRCPNDAEDLNGVNDEDGCPENDKDQDGIVNDADGCPDRPEDFDGFEDADGCPDLDNDKDGIVDLKDHCPNSPETINGAGDEDGCPDSIATVAIVKRKLTPRGTVVLHGVDFGSGSSKMSEDSKIYLEQILAELQSYPTMEIEIRGYTDSAGDYKSNVKLSYKRAEAVRVYLISEGVEQSRVSSKGFGPNNPIADNREALGRKKNRRIEVLKLQ
jgi:outer membrane protein OmpA-like peptidoglycan-associated protein